MKNYCFRAVYFKNRQDGGVDYRSVLINEAEEPYNTIGLYDLSEGKEDIEQNHIADMPREEFQLVLDSRFPNGFESWQKSHYEMVLALNDKLNNDRGFSLTRTKKLIDFVGSKNLTLHLTNKFEAYFKQKQLPEKDLQKKVNDYLSIEIKTIERESLAFETV